MGRTEATGFFLPTGARSHGLLKIGGKDNKNTNVLVVTDHFTRYAQAYVTSNQQASTVARVFVDNFVTNYGWPPKILTDQAKDFNGLLLSALC